MKLKPRTGDDLQLFRRGRDCWIKIGRGMLDDFAFANLPLASRSLAPMLWLLAAENGGVIDASDERIAFRLRISPKALREAAGPMIDAGLFIDLENVTSEPNSEEKTTNPIATGDDATSSLTNGCDADFSNYGHQETLFGDVAVIETPRTSGNDLPEIESRHKKNSGKKSSPPCAPDWLPRQIWEDYLKMRQRIRRPMTARAVELAFSKLDLLRMQGENPAAVIEQSIINSWTGLFSTRGRDGTGKKLSAHDKGSLGAAILLAEIEGKREGDRD